MTKIKICVCGGGNEGHAILGKLSEKADLDVTMISRQPQQWKNEIQVHDSNGICSTVKVKVQSYTHNSLSEADVILISVPSFSYKKILKRLADRIRQDAIVCAIPGSGGF